MTAQTPFDGAPSVETASCEVAKIAKISKTAKCLQRLRRRIAPERHAENFAVRAGVEGRTIHDRRRSREHAKRCVPLQAPVGIERAALAV